jgi:hypothetical protein
MSSAFPVWGRVQRVVENGCVSWTVIGDDRRPVEPVEVFLRWLTDTERSPNTVRAYAGDLRQFWEFLAVRGYEWTELGVEELGDFASWLRSPADNVVVLAGGVPARGGGKGGAGATTTSGRRAVYTRRYRPSTCEPQVATLDL